MYASFAKQPLLDIYHRKLITSEYRGQLTFLRHALSIETSSSHSIHYWEVSAALLLHIHSLLQRTHTWDMHIPAENTATNSIGKLLCLNPLSFCNLASVVAGRLLGNLKPYPFFPFLQMNDIQVFDFPRGIPNLTPPSRYSGDIEFR